MTEKIYISSDNLLTVDALYDSVAGDYVNDATVTATVVDRGGNEVSGQSWPVTLSYVALSDGKYQGVLADSMSVSKGKTYEVRVSVDGGAGKALEIRRRLKADYKTWT